MNSVYGKFIQDNRKHFEVKICHSYKTARKYMSSPLYKGHRILSEDVTAVYLNYASVKLDKLYATGFSILELSKDHMNKSWYDFIQPVLGADNVSIMLTDTDSFVLKVKNLSRKTILDRLTPIMDFSNYPKSHPRFSERNKAIPGFFKDENCGNYMIEIIGLKSKCYITDVQNREQEADFRKNVVCKGVVRSAKKRFTLDTYRDCVQNIDKVRASMYCIRSRKHQLYTQHISKIALSSFDDKRWLYSCGKHTIAHGAKHAEKEKCNECRR